LYQPRTASLSYFLLGFGTTGVLFSAGHWQGQSRGSPETEDVDSCNQLPPDQAVRALIESCMPYAPKIRILTPSKVVI